MKYLHHLFLVIGAFAVPISTQTTKFFTQQALNKNFSLDTPVYSSCGGVLNDSLAAITYESVETIHTYERCVWTIRSSGAAGYSLDVLSFGLEVNPDRTGIIASCLNANDIQLIQTSVDKLAQ
ncbi:hypothetical protein Ocin01_19291 [Orchesella cincta]|uniref:CUB domain-containing protein n=1 Tax=Orchesella cincta TaxID=48709 RepID=A0A1D2M3A2_ORCCI|nr:hypothetical protein Ocin01_19291 [Orchesella cincta]